MPTQIEHDVFISYSAKDQAWAEKLALDLGNAGLKVYRDEERLRPGDPDWTDSLLRALDSSRHLVALWSKNAAESVWVQRELGRFDGAVHPASGPPATDRRMILIALEEGVNTAYGDVQGLRGLTRAGIYPDGKPEGQAWNRAMERLLDELQYEEGTLTIPLLLLTMTATQVDDLDLNQSRLDGPALGSLLDKVGIDGKAGLRERYGDERDAWRPFGSESVAVLLSALRDELNADITEMIAGNGGGQIGVRRFRWRYVDDEFWASRQDAGRVAHRLASGPAVVVVDPLALYSDTVYEFHNSFGFHLLRNRQAFVLVLSPFAPPEPSVALRQALEVGAQQLYERFYRPLPSGALALARCGPNVADKVELSAWLASAIGPQFARGQSAVNEFTSTNTSS